MRGKGVYYGVAVEVKERAAMEGAYTLQAKRSPTPSFYLLLNLYYLIDAI